MSSRLVYSMPICVRNLYFAIISPHVISVCVNFAGQRVVFLSLLSMTSKEIITLRKGIHPENYREVVFMDVGANVKWLTRSTVKTTRTIEHEGKEYPLFTLDLSSHSHPFFTGKQKFVDSEGRVERFQKKFGTAARDSE